MKIDEVSKVSVLGAGTMGHGIAEVAALAGFDVTIYDIQQSFVDAGFDKIKWSLSKLVERAKLDAAKASAVLGRIKGTTDLEDAVADADVVIEAAPEDANLKKDLWAKVDKYTNTALLASNTSTIPISELASATSRPDDFIGLHFFNPPVLMPLLEVVVGSKTGKEAAGLASELGKKLGKQVIVCKVDVPGFIVNRILGPLLNEAVWLVVRKQATIEQVDSASVYKVGLPMGLFELADYSGIDTIYKASEAVKLREPNGIPVPPLLKEMFEQGKFGKKTGEGFYRYSGEGERPTIPRDAGSSIDPLLFFAPAINSAAWLQRNQVCGKEDIDLAVKLGLGFPEGILQLADRWGIDRVTSVLREKERAYGPSYKPDPLLEEMVDKGLFGVSSGRGFYDYSSKETKLEEVVVRKSPPLGWIVLNRAHRLNAITPKMVEELDISIRDLAADGSVRVVVVTGAGEKAFSVGADITSFDVASPSKVFDASRRWYEVFSLFEKIPKPVVAAMRGYAFGGGCELALACDFRLASEGSQIGLTETNLGLIPGAGGTQRLVRTVGLSRAKRMIFFGERVPAGEALKMGLVDEVFKNEEFESGVNEFATRLAKRSPLALKYAKYAVTLGAQVPSDLGQLFEASGFGLLLSTQDASEGISAMLEKREPEFKGE